MKWEQMDDSKIVQNVGFFLFLWGVIPKISKSIFVDATFVIIYYTPFEFYMLNLVFFNEKIKNLCNLTNQYVNNILQYANYGNMVLGKPVQNQIWISACF